MSTTIDQKVVEMRFDNRHFEANARESMSTLEKLKQKLNLSGASKGLENLNTSANKVNMNGLSSALDTVHSKFSAMEIVGITALANITNSAVNAGKRMVAALTVDPVKDGFNEYEMTLNAIQTTMAATGKTAKEVEVQLKSLDEYADKTVYSTADMLNNLPKFTNAGVELEDATTAMIGIANATALAGGDAGKASIAFYNLGQAIGTGYLTRMDYNSINNAGIATMEWKNQMVEAAIAAGTLKKVGEDSYQAGNKTLTLQQLFIDGLQEQWATTEVMMSVFKAYGDETTEIGKKAYASAQDIKTFSMMMDSLKATAGTGWKDTWQIIFGDLDEAKELWTGLTNFISKIITGMADFRNYILESALGRSFGVLLDNVKKPFKEVEKAVKSVADYAKVVDEIISGKWGNTEKRWNALTKAGYDWKHAQNLVNEKLGVSLRRATDYNETQKEVAKSQEKVNEATTKQIIDLIKLSDAQLKAKGYTDEQIKAFRQLEKVSKQTGIPLKQFIENIDEIDGRWILLNSFKNIGQGLVAVFKAMGKAWSEIFPADGIADGLFNMIAAFHKFTTYLTVSEEAADKLRRTFKGLFAILDIAFTIVAGPIKLLFKIFLQLLGALDIGFDGVLTFTAGIGDCIVAFHDWLDSVLDFTGIFKFLAPYIKAAAKALVEWLKSLKNSEIVRRFTKHLNQAKEALVEWFKGLKDADNIPKYIIEGLINGLRNGVGLVVDTMIEFGKKLIEAICKVLGIHSPSTKFYEIGKNIIQGLINGLRGGASAVFEFIKGLGSKCVELFKKIDFGKLLAAGIGIGMLVVVKKMLDVIGSFAAPLEGLGEMLDGIGDGFRNFGLGIKKWGQAKLIRSIADSILILAISVLLLSRIEGDALLKSIGAIVALAVVIGALTFVASKAENVGDISKLSVTFLGISGALLLMAGVFKVLAGINPEQMGSVIKGFAAMIIGMVALVASFGLLVKGDAAGSIHKVGAMIRKIAFALLIMVAVVKLASMLKADEIAKGMTVIVMFAGLIAGLIAVSKLAGTTGNKTGKMISKFAFSLLIMIGVIKLASMLKGEEIVKGMAVITMVGLFFAGLIAVSKFAGQHAGKAGAMLLMSSIALSIMVGVIKQIGKLKATEILKALPVLTVLGLFFAGLIAVSKFAGQNAIKAGAMLLMVSGALAILTAVLFVMSKMDTKELYKSLGIITVLELLFGGLMFVSQYAKDSMGSLIVITVAITLLVAALIGLTFIDAKKLAASTASISTVMTALALLLAATKYMNTDWKGLLKTLGPLVAVTAILGIILANISKLDPKSALPNAAALSVLLITLSGVAFVMSKMGAISVETLLYSIAGMLSMCVILYVLVDVLKQMDGIQNAATNATVLGAFMTVLSIVQLICAGVGAIYMATGGVAMLGLVGMLALLLEMYIVVDILKNMQNVENAMVNLNALSAFMILMTKILVALAIVGPLALIGVVAMGALTALMIGIGAFAIAVGAIMEKFPALQSFLDRGLPVLVQLAGGIGQMVGAFVGGMLAQISGSLPEIGTNLSNFMDKVTPFIEGAKKVDEKVLAGVAILAGAFLALTAASVISGLTSFLPFASSFADLGTQLSQFMINALPFITTAMMIPPNVIDTVKLLAEAILIITAANLIEGISRFLGGSSSLEKFGTQLQYLGSGVKDFITAIGPVTSDQVEAAKNAAEVIKTLAKAASEIPNTGGVLASLVGENDMAAWAQQLPIMAKGIVKFINTLTEAEISSSSVETAKTAAEIIKTLAKAASEIPNTGGLLASLIGDNDLATFAKGLPQVAKGIVGFVTTLTDAGISEESANIANTAAKVIKTLAKTAQDIPNTGGLLAALVGDNDLSDFAKKLPDVGKGIANFAKELGEFGPEKIDTVNSAVKAINAIAKLGKIDIKDTGSGLNSFGKNMVKFAKKIKEFVEHVGEVGGKSIDSSIKKCKDLIKMAQTVADTNIESLKTFGDSLKKFGKNGVKGFVKEFNGSTPKNDAKKAGKQLVQAVIDGMNDKKGKLKDKAKSLGSAASDSLYTKSIGKSAKQAGSDLAAGFANGIKSKDSITKVTAAGTAIGKAALKAAKEAIKSNSPSKEAMKIGNYFGQGLVIGIQEYEAKSYDAGYGIADNAKDGLSRAISKVSKIISSGIDAQPTIRPVLDLSDVESGAGYLNTMFNDGPSIGVMSNLRAISSGMNARSQNGSNGEVVSAINKLRKDLGNISGTTNNYNVNGITYDDGSNITDAVRTLVRAAKVERRV